MSVQTETVLAKVFVKKKNILFFDLFRENSETLLEAFFNAELLSELVLAIFQNAALSFITLDMGFYFQLFESDGRSSFPSDIYFNS